MVDGSGEIVQSFITVSVIPVNDFPIAADFVIQTTEDASVEIDVGSNVYDVEDKYKLVLTGVAEHGTISNIVVTLSKKAENTAVIIHKMNDNRQIEPPLWAYAWTAAHSNNPVFERILTITIMPISSPIVSQSIQVIIVDKSGPSPITCREITAAIPPTAAASARWTISNTIKV